MTARASKTLLAMIVVSTILPGCTAGPHLVHPSRVVYQGTSGPGVGKHLVLIAGDHEYRSEELLPALGRILARHLGFKVSVFFTLDTAGFIEPGSSRIQGLQALDSADLLILAIRFQDFPEAEMQHIVDYLDRGGPVIGLRTATHAFRIKSGPFAKYSWDYQGADYPFGFGEQVLGETWIAHWGTNHEQSSRIIPRPDQLTHPIFSGVDAIHVQSGGYEAHPLEGSNVLAVGQILNGMTSDAVADTTKPELPVVWTRTYQGAKGQPGRVFTSTHGASEDLLNPGFRRMLVNATLWALGMESAIRPDLDVSFVGPYYPVTFNFDGFRRGVRPSDLAGWDTPIMAPDRPTRDSARGDSSQ